MKTIEKLSFTSVDVYAMPQFCFIGRGDEQLSKRLGVIFLPAVSSSVMGASPERHLGESHPAHSFLARRSVAGPRGARQRGARGLLCVSFAEEHSTPGLCLLLMDWICLLIRATISGLLLDSGVMWVADRHDLWRSQW